MNKLKKLKYSRHIWKKGHGRKVIFGQYKSKRSEKTSRNSKKLNFRPGLRDV